ncbi:MAG: hypothetical protein EAZ77_08605 [Nostocales cyanobacterium]|nr:MAG: hypothetical protein EAZ77_08605 [Nostocales cyanobacterium]
MDNFNKTQLLALADFIIGLERGIRLTPDEQQAELLGAYITDILLLSSLERITRLSFVIQEIKGEIEIDQLANFDNDPGEGGNL